MKCCFVFDVTLQPVTSIHVYKMCHYKEYMLCNFHRWNKKTKTTLVIDSENNLLARNLGHINQPR